MSSIRGQEVLLFFPHKEPDPLIAVADAARHASESLARKTALLNQLQWGGAHRANRIASRSGGRRCGNDPALHSGSPLQGGQSHDAFVASGSDQRRVGIFAYARRHKLLAQEAQIEIVVGSADSRCGGACHRIHQWIEVPVSTNSTPMRRRLAFQNCRSLLPDDAASAACSRQDSKTQSPGPNISFCRVTFTQVAMRSG